MRAYYNVLDTLKTLLEGDNDINTVSQGQLDDVALNKFTTYALAHIIVNNVSVTNAIVRFNISVICMDVLSQTHADNTNIQQTDFRGKDNEVDVFNTMLAVVIRLVRELEHGDTHITGYSLNAINSIEPFTDRFVDDVAGWVLTMDIDTPHEMQLC